MKNFWRKASGILALAFCGAAAPLAAQQTQDPVPPAPTAATGGAVDGLWLWTDPGKNTNLVVHLRKCPDSNTACMTIHWIDPDGSRKSFDSFGEYQYTRIKINQEGNHEDLQNVTREDVLSLCGYSPPLKGAYDGGPSWRGKIEMRGRAEPLKNSYRPLEVNIDVVKIDDDTLFVHSTKSVRILGISKRVHNREYRWTRIQPDDPNYPACTPPSGPPQP